MPLSNASTPQLRAVREAVTTQAQQTYANSRLVYLGLRGRLFPDNGAISPSATMAGLGTDGKEIAEYAASLKTHVDDVGPLFDAAYKPLPDFYPDGWTATTATDGTVTLTQATAKPETHPLHAAGGEPAAGR